MERILAVCRENGATFSTLLATMFKIVLSVEFYPIAKIGVSRVAYDLRPFLAIDEMKGRTQNGDISNCVSSVQSWHRLEAFRKAIPFNPGQSNKSTVHEAPLHENVVWPLVVDLRDRMKNEMNGPSTRLWYVAKIMTPTIEAIVSQLFPAFKRNLTPTYCFSNLGAFSPEP